MHDVAVIEDAAAAEVSLDPMRARMLAELAEPHTATMLAARLGLARQKVNYHVKTLEQHGLVELVEERRKGNMTERVVRASAAAYVISPAALAAVAPDPARSPDRLSARWLLALAARLVRETGALIDGAARAGKPLATFGLDAEVRFAKPPTAPRSWASSRTRLAGIISKYQTDTGRPHRLIVAVHPCITEDADPPAEEQHYMTHPFEVRNEFTVDATPEEVWDGDHLGAGSRLLAHGAHRNRQRQQDQHVRHVRPGVHRPHHGLGTRSPLRDRGGQEPGRHVHGLRVAHRVARRRRRGGARCAQRLCSATTGKAEYNGLSVGDHAYMTKLAVYLEHFAPRTAKNSAVPAGAGHQGLVGGHDGGGRRRRRTPRRTSPARLSVPRGMSADGTVEFVVSPSFVGMRTGDAMYMLIHGYNDMVFATAHYFDDRDRRPRPRRGRTGSPGPRGLIRPAARRRPGRPGRAGSPAPGRLQLAG